MSLLNSLKIKKGSKHRKKLLGRGMGSGRGGTSTNGHKGQKARSGGQFPRQGFEGGQTPLQRRTPKYGFVNPFRTDFQVVNIESFTKLSGEISPEVMKKEGLIKGRLPVKVLGHGKLSKGLTVKAHKFSKSAKTAIESSGGKAEVLE
ncbi:MAG: 50S ribosomal protein L15 [Proteobacteria bacterium SG_bin7]|nr:MAG: 50S ribosomal protein L15 [Proteobacteria bacterium SG_bin7]